MALSKMCRCGAIIKIGEQCTRCNSRHYRYDVMSRDKKYSRFYHSREWTQMTKVVRSMYANIDIYQLYVHGKLVPSEMVHHIVAIKEDFDRRLDYDNLIALSHKSHAEVEATYRRSEYDKHMMQALLIECKNKFKQGEVKKVLSNHF